MGQTVDQKELKRLLEEGGEAGAAEAPPAFDVIGEYEIVGDQVSGAVDKLHLCLKGGREQPRKPSVTNDDSLRKMPYLASAKIIEHWTARCRNWDQVISQLNILFSDRAAG